jgi:hypothetical protein
MARDLDGLPWVEAAEDRSLDLDQLALQAADFVGLLGAERSPLERRDAVLEFDDRLLEGEAVQSLCHRCCS